MFDILSVELTNFRSYYGSHKFSFPKEAGLYSLTGINQLNPRLSSNDCGKTTLLEAIYWCLYGKTSRGLRAGDVVAWGEKSCEVHLTIKIGERTHTIERAQSPNELRLEGEIVSQSSLEKTLRIGPEEFLYAIMLPQFGNSFFDLGPSEKLSLFSSIMDLDYWLDRAKDAGELSKELLQSKQELERKKAYLQGKFASGVADIEKFSHLAADFIATQKSKVINLKTVWRRKRKEVDELKNKFAQNQQQVEKINKKLKVIQTACPTCKQPIQSTEYATLLRNSEDFKSDMHRCERQLSSLVGEMESYEDRIQEEIDRRSPYEDMVNTKTAEIKDIKAKCEEIVFRILGLESTQAQVDFWVSGFKRVRLYIVENTLRQLEIEVNNNLANLGLTDWMIKFDIERENKGGGVTKGFTVLVFAPNRTEPTRWEAFGGGATQRLRLAGNLGLANLIMERRGLRSNVEFYDEPSHHLSNAGISDLLATLQERAKLESKRIWVVDHHSLDFGFDGQIVVTKDEKGSSLSSQLE